MVMKNPISVTGEIWKSYAKNKDIQTRNFIMMEYSYIVKILASRIYSTYKNYADYDDIISCGMLALLNSVEKYDCTRDIKFETFASIGVRGAMIDYLRKQDWVPRALRKSVKDIDRTYEELQIELGRTPSDNEMAEKLDMSIDDYHELLGKTYSLNVLSLEEIIAEGAENAFSSRDSEIEQQVEKKELSEMLVNAVESLSEKERIIVSLYYYEGLKAKQIATVLEVSESRVSQLHAKALMKLKYNLRKYIEIGT